MPGVRARTHRLAVVHVLLVQVLNQHLEGTLALARKRGRLECRLLRVDQLHQQELAECGSVLCATMKCEMRERFGLIASHCAGMASVRMCDDARLSAPLTR